MTNEDKKIVVDYMNWPEDVASLLVYKENAIINFRLGVENE